MLLLLLLLLLNEEFEKSNKISCGSETRIGNNIEKNEKVIRSFRVSLFARTMITLFQKACIRNNPSLSSSPSSVSCAFLLGAGEGRL